MYFKRYVTSIYSLYKYITGLRVSMLRGKKKQHMHTIHGWIRMEVQQSTATFLGVR